MISKYFKKKLTPIILAIIFTSQIAFAIDTIPNKNIKIKVLLGQYNSSEKSIFDIGSKFQLMVKNNVIYARKNKKPFKKISSDKVHIKSKRGDIKINTGRTCRDKGYNGMISFILKNNKLLIVNKLDLEDYVYAVLLAESYQSWPHEMQKIQAIISRTYAVRQIAQNRKKNLYYDIMRNTFHQRYNGNHKYEHLRRAVEETKNLILVHDNQIVLTMFDACCGGSIPAQMKGIDFKKAPYLERKIPCNFCKNYKLYRWKRKIPVQKFLTYLYNYKPIAKKLPKKKSLEDIFIVKKNKTGVVSKIKLKHCKNKKTFIGGKDLWMSMSNIVRSQNFSIKKDKNYITIDGRGFGHQIGFCQRGGRELVRRGWPVKKILEFYYPKTKVARLV